MNTNPMAGAPADAVAFAASEARVTFLKRTYTHLAGSVAVFIALLAALLQMPGIEAVIRPMVSSGISWLLVLGAFMLVSRVAEKWATNAVSTQKQYMGLGLFIVAEAILFLPMIYVASNYFPPDEHLLLNASILTVGTFAGLTAIVFISGKDFSFLGGMLKVGFLVALGLIVVSAIAGFSLGLMFIGGMILLASGSILYNTSNVLHHYRTSQHVAAALSLFASVALLFWYILQLLMSLSSRD